MVPFLATATPYGRPTRARVRAMTPADALALARLYQQYTGIEAETGPGRGRRVALNHGEAPWNRVP